MAHQANAHAHELTRYWGLQAHLAVSLSINTGAAAPPTRRHEWTMSTSMALSRGQKLSSRSPVVGRTFAYLKPDQVDDLVLPKCNIRADSVTYLACPTKMTKQVLATRSQALEMSSWKDMNRHGCFFASLTERDAESACFSSSSDSVDRTLWPRRRF